MIDFKMWFNENIRIIIHKFPWIYKLCLIIVRDYGKIYFKKLCNTEHYDYKLRELKDTKLGKRCFIIGNGPSLNGKDLELLIDEDCFASNRIYKIFPNTKWRPQYYSVVDWRGLDNKEVNSLEVKNLFLGDYFWRKHNITRKDVYVFYGHRLLDTDLSSFKFSPDISEQVYLGATVTFANLQIAVYMGYSEIYLLGMDHSYSYVRGQKGTIVKNDDVKQTHFFNDKDPSKDYADMSGMTNAYITAKKYADKRNIKIINATRGGKLEIFPRVDFDSIFLQRKQTTHK